jgi:Orotidine-5''-phosphate decarboxylase
MLRPKYLLAMDSPLSPSTLEKLRQRSWGIKVGVPLLLRLGVQQVKGLVRDWERVVCDMKLADIDSTMVNTVDALDGLCSALIAHALVGKRGALDTLRDVTRNLNISLYLLVSMSHPGWDDSLLGRGLLVAKEVDPEGLVGPATRPLIITRIRETFPSKLILAPGVGAQGASPGQAMCFGADVEIVGRKVYSSPDPVKTMEEVIDEAERKLMECEGATARRDRAE